MWWFDRLKRPTLVFGDVSEKDGQKDVSIQLNTIQEEGQIPETSLQNDMMQRSGTHHVCMTAERASFHEDAPDIEYLDYLTPDAVPDMNVQRSGTQLIQLKEAGSFLPPEEFPEFEFDSDGDNDEAADLGGAWNVALSAARSKMPNSSD